MRKILFLFLVSFVLVGFGQRSGADSISVKTAVLRFVPFSTTEMNALGRVNTDIEAGIIWNTTTQTLWAYDGNSWKDLGLAPIEGGITIDTEIDTISTNPVENKAIGKRFLSTVDEADDSPFNDLKIWWGVKADLPVSKDPRTMYVVTDSTITGEAQDPLIDGFVNDVNLVGNTLYFIGQGGAVTKEIDLSEITLTVEGEDLDQQIETFDFTSPSSFDVELKLSGVSGRTLSLAKFFQTADEVSMNDGTLPVFGNDVQEVMEKLYQAGSYNKTMSISEIDIEDDQGLNINQAIVLTTSTSNGVIRYTKQGNILFVHGSFLVGIQQGINENHFAALEFSVPDITDQFLMDVNNINFFPMEVSISEESELAARGLIVNTEAYVERSGTNGDLKGSIIIFPAPKGVIDQGAFQLDKISGGGYRRDWVVDTDFPSIFVNISGFIPIDKQ